MPGYIKINLFLSNALREFLVIVEKDKAKESQGTGEYNDAKKPREDIITIG